MPEMSMPKKPAHTYGLRTLIEKASAILAALFALPLASRTCSAILAEQQELASAPQQLFHLLGGLRATEQETLKLVAAMLQ